MNRKSIVRKVQMWGVYVKDMKRPIGLFYSRKSARDIQRTYETLLDQLVRKLRKHHRP